MNDKRPVYVPVEMPYRVSPLEEMLEASLARVGRHLGAPLVEFSDGYAVSPPEIVVSREYAPQYGVSLSCRKWLTVPPRVAAGINASGPARDTFGNGTSALPIPDKEVRAMLAVRHLLENESVLFRFGQHDMDVRNYPARDGTGGLLNDFYTYPDFDLLRKVKDQFPDPDGELHDIVANCQRRHRRAVGSRVSGHTARLLMDAVTLYVFSSLEELSSSS